MGFPSVSQTCGFIKCIANPPGKRAVIGAGELAPFRNFFRVRLERAVQPFARRPLYRLLCFVRHRRFPCRCQAKTGYRKNYNLSRYLFRIILEGRKPERKKEKIVNCALHNPPRFIVYFLHHSRPPPQRERTVGIKPENEAKRHGITHFPNAHLNAHKCPKSPNAHRGWAFGKYCMYWS
jgi:hypothetical protein